MSALPWRRVFETAINCRLTSTPWHLSHVPTGNKTPGLHEGEGKRGIETEVGRGEVHTEGLRVDCKGAHRNSVMS
jgi:hypothetical protein